MTPAKKWLTFGFMFTLILGGGAGGAYYYHQRELRAAYDRAGKDLWISRSRSLLLEAALATRYGNYAMAFERVVRAQAGRRRQADPPIIDVVVALVAQAAALAVVLAVGAATVGVPGIDRHRAVGHAAVQAQSAVPGAAVLGRVVIPAATATHHENQSEHHRQLECLVHEGGS